MTRSSPIGPPHRSDPARFVAEAEAVTNAADHERAAALYAPDATLTVIIDGTQEVHRGRAHIARAWDSVFGGLVDRSVRVTKDLVSADADALVNRWSGSDGSRGLEVWQFDADGMVVHSELLGFLAVRPSTHPLAQFRVAIGAPRAALATLRHHRRVGLWPRRRAIRPSRST